MLFVVVSVYVCARTNQFVTVEHYSVVLTAQVLLLYKFGSQKNVRRSSVRAVKLFYMNLRCDNLSGVGLMPGSEGPLRNTFWYGSSISFLAPFYSLWGTDVHILF